MKKALVQISAVTTYFFASVITIILNKLILGALDFKMHYFLILIQSLIIVLIMILYNLSTRKSFSLLNINKWYLTSVLLSIMIFSGIKTLYYFPVTLFTLYKNLSVIPMAFLEFKFFDKKITVNSMVSLVLMVLSSYTAQIADSIPICGYFWMLSNIISTTAYMLYLKEVMEKDNTLKLESVFYTNLLCIPIMGVLSYFFDPMQFQIENMHLWSVIGISSLCAFMTALSTVWTLQTVSSTALYMIGALNKVILSTSGFVLFDEIASFGKVLSLCIGIFASGLYSYHFIKSKELLPVAIPIEEV